MREKIVPLSAILSAAVILIVMVVMEARPLPAADVPAGNLRVVSGPPAVMLDEATGKTWVLVTSTNLKRNAWVPIRKLETDADVEKWQITGSAREPLDKEKPGSRD